MYNPNYKRNHYVKVEMKPLNKRAMISSLRGSLEMKNLEKNISIKIEETVNHHLFNKLMTAVSDMNAFKVVELLKRKLGGY